MRDNQPKPSCWQLWMLAIQLIACGASLYFAGKTAGLKEVADIWRSTAEPSAESEASGD